MTATRPPPSEPLPESAAALPRSSRPRSLGRLSLLAAIAVTPKCILCAVGYTSLGAALGLGGPELCGASPGGWAPLSLVPWLMGIAVAQAARIRLANCSFSGRPIPVNPSTTVTVLPPRPPVSRRISTRPRFFTGAAGTETAAVLETEGGGAEGSPAALSAPNGL